MDKIKDVLDLKTSQIVLPITAPGTSEIRLTLTARVLRAARKIHFLLNGLDKKMVLDKALKAKDNWESAPIRSVLFGENPVTIHYAN